MKLTHSDYKNYILTLAGAVRNNKRGYTYESVYGIPRGGQYPAVELAKELGLPCVTNPDEVTSKTLIVDDLVDSGKTMTTYRLKWPACHFCAVVVKEGAAMPDYFGIVATREWITFPDEHDGTDIEDNFRRTLEFIGEDTSREGLLETPKRMRRAYEEIFAGYKTNPKDLVKTFVQGTCKEMVILKNAEFYSTCEHHFFPFFGHCSIGYLPNDKVIGVSKLARLLDCFAKRMQIQERMTAQIADFLEEELGALGVYVVCEGVHFCMTSRGIKKQDASMVTSAVRGLFKTNYEARAEFLHLIGK